MEGVPLLGEEEHAEEAQRGRQIDDIHSEENKMADPLTLMVGGRSYPLFL